MLIPGWRPAAHGWATRRRWLATYATAGAIACDLSSSIAVPTTPQMPPPVVVVAAIGLGTLSGDSDETQITVRAGVPSSSHCLTVVDYNNCYFYIITAIGPSGPIPPPTINASGPDTLNWSFTAPGWSLTMGTFSAAANGVYTVAQMTGTVTQPIRGTADTVQVLWWAWTDGQVGQAADSERLVPTVKPAFDGSTPLQLTCAVGGPSNACNPVIPEASRRGMTAPAPSLVALNARSAR